MSGWQPMATAPRDGTDVLLYRVTPSGRAMIPIVAGYFDNGGESGWSTWDQDSKWLEDHFTHWQPLPEPPAEFGNIGADGVQS